jgi:hypothetical protein
LPDVNHPEDLVRQLLAAARVATTERATDGTFLPH